MATHPNNFFATGTATAMEPPGGIQENGEFGPYYVYEGDTIVEIPPQNIVRDYDYAYHITEQDLKSMISDGWFNSFESSALLSHRPLKSRAIVVVSDNGWVDGRETTYSWFIRVDIKIDRVNKPGTPLWEYGRHILWPITPDRACNARERWMQDEILRTSRLVELYKPSDKPFTFTQIATHTVMRCVDPSTLELVETLKPAETPPATHKQRSVKPLVNFAMPDEDDDGTLLAPLFPRHVSQRNKVTRVMRFTAMQQNDWNDLPSDVQEFLWELLAEEAVNTHGGLESDSLRMWLCLRAINRQSKAVVERVTLKLMVRACLAVLTSRRSYKISDAIVVRDLLVHRGISPHTFTLELDHQEAKGNVASTWTLVHSYIRIRTGKPPTENAPAPVSRRSANAARSSLRIRIMRSKHAATAPASTPAITELKPVVEVMPFNAVSLKLNMRPKPPKSHSTQPVPRSNPLAKQKLPVQTPTPTAPEKPKNIDRCTWVQCTECDKWRRLPKPKGGLFDALSCNFLPTKWNCSFHPESITCETAEDDVEEEEVFNP